MVHFAPLKLPLSRRLQTLSVIIWLFFHPAALTLSILLLFNWFTAPFIVIYFLWAIFDQAPFNGSRSAWARNLQFWNYFRDYFPISLHKTVDLDPSKSYIFGCHPHGIISFGAFCNFASEATGFSSKFPGIKMRLLTLTQHFRIPFFREYLLSHGVCDCSRTTCLNLLKKEPGSAILLVVGGASEALDSRPKTYDVILQKRKGFVKVALQAGASLVPVLSFGEVDVYDQVNTAPDSKLRSFQKLFQRIVGMSLPLFKGRGVFQYDYGVLPQRCPINTVVGAPIDCPKVENLTEEIINEYHEKYVAGLQKIFDDYKDRFAPDRKGDLNIHD